jgi:D-aminoacyl-tRNA deacylase
MNYDDNNNHYHYTIVASEQDPAAITMTNYILDSFSNDTSHLPFKLRQKRGRSFISNDTDKIMLFICKESALFQEDLDTLYPKSKAFIFLSKHVSESKIPTLTAHFTGNFADNLYGGNRRQIAIAYPYLLKQYIMSITPDAKTLPGYEVIIEASHHGPTSLKKPTIFIEIGSTERQWNDKDAAAFVCEHLLEILLKEGGGE